MPKPITQPTTAQSLGALLKSARDIMRKDKGLNGDLDRLPMLTWIMFLKFLDDLELQREGEAKLTTKKFKPAIEPPYRWRDWAAKSDGITGDELLAFINNEETTLPNSLPRATTRGPGLFRYLRTLTSSNSPGIADAREVIATVFRGVQNRMVSGYLLRDVINKLNGIHFTASDELHTLGALYESMLREMRDAAGDSGEFYTPRAVVRLMVAVTDPRLGETVLDPASGTGGFLVEAFNHLSKQVKTVADRRVLQDRSLFGCEPKTLPYLLCQMNLLLHGLDAPQIDPGNSLRFKLTDIGERDRVDVILTNPPFGGEEEKGIQGNFPEDKQSAETALLFLQLIMRKLRRLPQSSAGGSPASSGSVPLPGTKRGGTPLQLAAGTAALRYSRAAVVVPNGTLFGDGVCARIKEELLKEFNLHTIVRLPNGVFAPYTSIPTNILFFDRSGPTREVWYYEQPLPEGRKNYTKTAPIQFEEFAPLVAWWDQPGPGTKREENERAWKVSAAELLANGCNLDRKNPRAKEDVTHLPPTQLAAAILKKEQRIAEIMGNIQKLLTKP
jgi:type I restriction enzyme M protein